MCLCLSSILQKAGFIAMMLSPSYAQRQMCWLLKRTPFFTCGDLAVLAAGATHSPHRSVLTLCPPRHQRVASQSVNSQLHLQPSATGKYYSKTVSTLSEAAAIPRLFFFILASFYSSFVRQCKLGLLPTTCIGGIYGLNEFLCTVLPFAMYFVS